MASCLNSVFPIQNVIGGGINPKIKVCRYTCHRHAHALIAWEVHFQEAFEVEPAVKSVFKSFLRDPINRPAYQNLLYQHLLYQDFVFQSFLRDPINRPAYQNLLYRHLLYQDPLCQNLLCQDLLCRNSLTETSLNRTGPSLSGPSLPEPRVPGSPVHGNWQCWQGHQDEKA